MLTEKRANSGVFSYLVYKIRFQKMYSLQQQINIIITTLEKKHVSRAYVTLLNIFFYWKNNYYFLIYSIWKK